MFPPGHTPCRCTGQPQPVACPALPGQKGSQAVTSLPSLPGSSGPAARQTWPHPLLGTDSHFGSHSWTSSRERHTTVRIARTVLRNIQLKWSFFFSKVACARAVVLVLVLVRAALLSLHAHRAWASFLAVHARRRRQLGPGRDWEGLGASRMRTAPRPATPTPSRAVPLIELIRRARGASVGGAHAAPSFLLCFPPATGRRLARFGLGAGAGHDCARLCWGRHREQ